MHHILKLILLPDWPVTDTQRRGVTWSLLYSCVPTLHVTLLNCTERRHVLTVHYYCTVCVKITGYPNTGLLSDAIQSKLSWGSKQNKINFVPVWYLLESWCEKALWRMQSDSNMTRLKESLVVNLKSNSFVFKWNHHSDAGPWISCYDFATQLHSDSWKKKKKTFGGENRGVLWIWK